MYPSQDNPGYGIFVKNVAEGLQKNGITTKCISVIAGRGKNALQKIIKYLCFYGSILKRYFTNYDLIYCHFPTYSAPILYLLMHLKRRKLVINFHGEDLLYYDESRLQQNLGKISDKLTLKYATAVVVPSEYYKQIVVDRGLAKKESVFVSPSGGINEDIFKLQPSRRDENVLHLGFVGRLEELKGVLEFIDACVKLHELHTLKATIIGYGPLNDLVKDRIKEFPYIELINGVPQRELPVYYSMFDLFVFPSKRKCESLGLVGIEAMACGTPIIGSNIGGIVSYLRHGANGFVAHIDNLVDDIVASSEIYRCMQEADKHEMMLCGVETAKKYKREVVCEELSKFFKAL